MAKDETKKAVDGWRAIKGQKREESRQQRIDRERRERLAEQKETSADAKRRAIMEAQEYAENEIENPMRHLKNAYKAKQKAEKNKRIVKLDAQKALLLLCEVSEKGGQICSVEESGFNVFTVKYLL